MLEEAARNDGASTGTIAGGGGQGQAAAAVANGAATTGTEAGKGAAAANGAGAGQPNGQSADAGKGAATVAAGADVAAEDASKQAAADAQHKSYWPDDWREKIAEFASAGDKKAYEKELRRLQNMESPLAVYGSFRNMENTWASRNFIKKPGENAKPEEVAEYHKALGVPEKAED